MVETGDRWDAGSIPAFDRQVAIEIATKVAMGKGGTRVQDGFLCPKRRKSGTLEGIPLPSYFSYPPLENLVLQLCAIACND
jgi:hypothetical protein